MKKVTVLLFALIVALGLVFGNVALNAQSNNPLVQKLVELFRGVDDSSINNAVARAKRQLNNEVKETRRNNFEELFDSQIATLNSRGVPQETLRRLHDQKKVVIDKASKMTIGNGNIPFIPVVKPSYLGYYGLMSLVHNGANKGYAYIDPDAITDKEKTPNKLYYIYDVEDGEAMRGKSSKTTEKLLKAQNRYPLTVAEAIALATHTDVLSRHSMDIPGSRYDSDYVPFLWLYDGQPRLGSGWATSSADSNSNWGSASCGAR